MGHLKTELINSLKGFAPYEQIALLYQDKRNFFREMNNYLVGGLVLSTPKLFLMAKPISRSSDPNGQWYVEDPDCWYVRWAAGTGGLKEMMDAVQPLPYVKFRRITMKGDTKLRTYKWDNLYRRVKSWEE